MYTYDYTYVDYTYEYTYDYISYHENHVNIKRKKCLHVILFKINFMRKKRKKKVFLG